MKFEDVKNVKVGDKLKVVDIKLCSNLEYEINRGNLENGDTIILTVTNNDGSSYKPFLCSINVNGKDKGVKWWISHEAVEVVAEQQSNTKEFSIEFKPILKLKSGDKIVRTGGSVPRLMVEEGSVYTVKDVFERYTITLEECRNEFDYHYTFIADNFKLLDGVHPASEILGESISTNTDENSKTPSGVKVKQPTGNRVTTSGGGSASYYKKEIPKGLLEKWNEKGVIETSEVIRLFLGNDFTHGNIFKASCRIIGSRNGEGKKGVSEEYDLDKQVYFAEDDVAWNELFK